MASSFGFGPERGRDIVIVVEDTRFHVHSVMVCVFLNGKVFDTLVEQAYGNEQREMCLCDDSPKAWQALLQWIYKSAHDPMQSWDINDALLVVPLAHKYEGDRMLLSIGKTLTSNSTKAKRIRTPQAAEILVAHHMDSVLNSWFCDEEWATDEVITSFLKGSNVNQVRLAALSCAWKRLPSAVTFQTEALVLNATAELLPSLALDSQNLAVKLLGRPGCMRSWSSALAKTLVNVGFGHIAAAWFHHSDWPMTVEIMDQCLHGACPNEIVLSIISRITHEAQQLGATCPRNHATTVKAMICRVVLHCTSSELEVPVTELVEAIPKSQRNAEIAGFIACRGFLQTVLSWMKSMSKDDLQTHVTTSDQIELVRAASLQLQNIHLQDFADYREQQRKSHQTLEEKVRKQGKVIVLNGEDIGESGVECPALQGESESLPGKFFSWEAVGRAVAHYESEGFSPWVVCQRARLLQNPPPQGICARVVESPIIVNEGHETGRGSNRICVLRLAKIHGCPFVDNSTYLKRQWKAQDTWQWLVSGGADLKIEYTFDCFGEFLPVWNAGEFFVWNAAAMAAVARSSAQSSVGR
jgi:hypothetical protein